MIASTGSGFDRLLNLLFPEERADLDFGLYRLLNAKRNALRQFFKQDLPSLLEGVASSVSPQKEIEDEISALRLKANDLGISVEQIPRYKQLQGELSQGGSSVIGNEALRHLEAFISRHYVDGDFIPMRRYKSDAYLVPYDGSETTLVYANQDQYFTKSDQNFDTFRVRFTDGRRVQCVVIEAEEKLGNNEDGSKQKRRYRLKTLEATDEELTLGFAFVPTEKRTQADLTAEAVSAVRERVAKTEWLQELFRLDKAQKPWVELFIDRFTKNAEKDYFVHKDLKRFLSSELERYIFADVFPRHDLRDDDALRVSSRIESALRRVAAPLIELLSQFEDLQRDLWIKPRLVLKTDYCLTLDRLPLALVSTAIGNDAQREEWKKLFGIDKSEAISSDSHGGLFVDTRHFGDEFRAVIEASGVVSEDNVDGLVIVSENTAALRTYMRKFRGTVDAIYVDPPFNTGSGSSFRYKNGYRHSSWCCLMEDAIALGGELLADDGVIAMAIDDEEFARLQLLADRALGENRRLGTQVFVTKHGGRTRDRFLATSHEYALYYASAAGGASVSFAPLTDEQRAEYKFEEPDGSRFKWRDFMRTGGLSFPKDRPHSDYPIFWHEATGCVVVFADPDVRAAAKRKAQKELKAFLEMPGASVRDDLGELPAYVYQPSGAELPSPEDFTSVRAVDSAGSVRVWRKTRIPFMLHVARDQIRFVSEDDRATVDIKDYEKKGTRPSSVADDKRFNATAYGTNLLKKMFGESRVFSYPKALGSVQKALEQMVGDDDEAVVCDYFAGSGTTGHAVMELNREGGNRRYILVEMAEYVDEVTIPRLKKAAYSTAWVDGLPTSVDPLAHTIKVVRLESYEDCLENIEISAVDVVDETLQAFPEFRREFAAAALLKTEVLKSSAFLPASALQKGTVTISVLDHSGIRRNVDIDLGETFSVWFGLRVEYRVRRDGIQITIGRRGDHVLCIVIRNAAVSSAEIADTLRSVLGDREIAKLYINGDVSAEVLRSRGINDVISIEEVLVADG